jgi:prepilin-type processing-associated H-X9-DG protein
MTRARDLADLLNGGKTIASATISGDLTVANKIQHDGDTDSFIQFDGADSLNISTGGGEKILINNTGMTVNEDSADLDFRVESNGNANMLFVDGGNDRVGIGTNSPGHLLHLKNSNPTIRLEDSDGASNIYGLLQADGAGSVYIKADDAGNSGSTKIAFDVDGSEKLRIQTGGGISFNGDTAAANALDDYEEGQWTPTISTGTIGSSYAYYTKVGNLVTLNLNVHTISNRTDTGTFSIGGLPYTSSSNNRAIGVVMHRYIDDAGEDVTAWVDSNVSSLKFYISQQSSNWAQLKHNDLMSASAQIYMTVTYQAA